MLKDNREIIVRDFNLHHEHVSIHDLDHFDTPKEELIYGVNWAGCGKTDVTKAAKFIQTLDAAIRLCFELNKDVVKKEKVKKK